MSRSAEEAKREVCSHCGQPLVELLWSKSEPGERKYILICDNARCVGYRNPVKTITREVEYGQEQKQEQGKKREKETQGQAVQKAKRRRVT